MTERVSSLLRHQAARLVAVIGILTAFGFARLPVLSETEREKLAARFNFTPLLIQPFPVEEEKHVRAVNPNLQPISAWISAVGAAVALNDLDGDGLPNDLCHVDPRNDLITVAPVPGTGDRFRPYVLSAQPLPYDQATMAPMGCLPADLNEDGHMDIVGYFWGRSPIVFLHTESGYRPVELADTVERWYTNAATVADLDGDGHADLVVTNYFQDGARILDANARTPDQMQHSMSRAFNGGSTRFFLWTDSESGAGAKVEFREVRGVLAPRHDAAWTLAVGAADLDGDLLPELYFANDFGPDTLLHNRSRPGTLSFVALEGERRMATPKSKVLGRDSFKGMGVDFADLNGDGLLDIYVSNIAAQYALEESHFVYLSTGHPEHMMEGIAPYVDGSEPLGLSRSDWSWESRFADFDNDGVMEAIQATGFVKGVVDRWPELQELAMGNDELVPYVGAWCKAQPGDDLSGHAPNAFFVKAADGRYYDIASSLGLGQPQVTRGIATADVDGDGDIDFAVANQWENSHFYRNDCTECGGFLGLYLRLPVADAVGDSFAVQPGRSRGPSRPAIGASVALTLPDGTRRVGQVDGGNGHSGKRSSEIHFGLGTAKRDVPLHVDIRWRDSAGVIRTRKLDLKPGFYTVTLGRL